MKHRYKSLVSSINWQSIESTHHFFSLFVRGWRVTWSDTVLKGVKLEDPERERDGYLGNRKTILIVPHLLHARLSVSFVRSVNNHAWAKRGSNWQWSRFIRLGKNWVSSLLREIFTKILCYAPTKILFGGVQHVLILHALLNYLNEYASLALYYKNNSLCISTCYVKSWWLIYPNCPHPNQISKCYYFVLQETVWWTLYQRCAAEIYVGVHMT